MMINHINPVLWIDFEESPAYTSRMNLKLSFVVAVLAVLIAGCSSVPSRVDKGPVRASTYSLMASKTPANAVANSDRAEVHAQIQAAIIKELDQKGLKQVSNGGDVKVGYLVIVADNATTATYGEYFGYGGDAKALSEKAHKELAKKNSRDHFEVGALVIDVTDARDSKLLYRSYVLTDVQELTPGNRADRIDRLVASCLGKLRVGG